MTSSVIGGAGVDSAQQIVELLTKFIDGTNCSAMSEEVLAQHRKDMSKVQSKAKEGLAKTARKELNFDDQEISEYIDWVLQRGFELVATNPGDAPKLNDAQTVKRYGALIEERVKVSPFGEDRFKIAALRVQRKSIEESATLHELRQNIKAMIPVLNLYREHETLRADYKKIMDFTDQWVSVQEHDQVLLELERVQALSDEYRRVIYGITDGLFNPEDEFSDSSLLEVVEFLKQKYECSDEYVAKVLGINRTKITRLRKKIQK